MEYFHQKLPHITQIHTKILLCFMVSIINGQKWKQMLYSRVDVWQWVRGVGNSGNRDEYEVRGLRCEGGLIIQKVM